MAVASFSRAASRFRLHWHVSHPTISPPSVACVLRMRDPGRLLLRQHVAGWSNQVHDVRTVDGGSRSMGVAMVKLIGISGSLRRGSFNTALLRTATELVPSGAELVTETLHGVPLYDGDVETAHGLPERVTELKEAIAAADGLLLATPEYNNSIPGVFKNAIDWLSRPPADIPRIFARKPVAVLGASPGGFVTILSQNAWLPGLRTLGTSPWCGGRLLVSRAGTVFDDAGRMVNDTTKEQLRHFIEGYVAFVQNAPA